MGWKERAWAELEAARARTLRMLEGLPEAELVRQHSPLMSPLVWDMAHVANYEEQWLVRTLGGKALAAPELDSVYDAFRHPRRTRSELPLLSPSEAWAYAVRVREAVREVWQRVPEDSEEPLLRGGFVFGMVAQHEQQHAETLCATLQLMRWEYRPAAQARPQAPTAPRHEVLIPGGPLERGSSHPWAYDNERPVHTVELAPYLIDSHPVTNGDYRVFVESGGYAQPRWWQPEGLAWAQAEGLRHPLFWHREGGRWWRRRFGHMEELPLSEPVQHVSWYEAEAYARWAGRRLPTEAEWERAAVGPQGRRSFPWGEAWPGPEHANLGGNTWGPASVGAWPAGTSAEGVSGLLGDVWEWTASDFNGYPGFEAFPYREYSEVFFGTEYKVLKGGSWASAPVAVRNSFRNWDFPIRRQIFAGFRCARDAR